MIESHREPQFLPTVKQLKGLTQILYPNHRVAPAVGGQPCLLPAFLATVAPHLNPFCDLKVWKAETLQVESGTVTQQDERMNEGLICLSLLVYQLFFSVNKEIYLA